MKKTLVLIMTVLIIGIILGTKIHSATTTLENTFASGTTYYFLQEGVYTSERIMLENTENIDAKVVNYENNKYYVFLGITKDESVAQKIKNIYSEKGYEIYIKEQKLNNEEFSSNVTQFDLLLNNTDDKDEIITITEVVLANYEEIVKKQ